jgi:hypothetical protein
MLYLYRCAVSRGKIPAALCFVLLRTVSMLPRLTNSFTAPLCHQHADRMRGRQKPACHPSRRGLQPTHALPPILLKVGLVRPRRAQSQPQRDPDRRTLARHHSARHREQLTAACSPRSSGAASRWMIQHKPTPPVRLRLVTNSTKRSDKKHDPD